MGSSQLTPAAAGSGDRIRARLLTAMHMGNLRPGDRVPSVRRLAGLTGLNHKTVHRAYRALAREGVLEVRRGSGTYVTERRAGAGGQPATDGLLRLLDRCRSDAESLGLTPPRLSAFLDICFCDGLRGTPVSVVECNLEQIGMIGRDLTGAMGVRATPVLLDDLERDAAAAAAGAYGVVTTDCHWTHVAELLEPLGVPVYAVSLDAEFPQAVLRAAAHRQVLIVVRDQRFRGVFLRLLGQLARDPEVVRSIALVEEAGAREALRAAERGALVCVSPFVESLRADELPPHVEAMPCSWHVPADALDRVRAGLALDLALRHGA